MTLMNQHVNFFISVILMILFSLGLYHFLFKREGNIYFLLLIGLIFGTFFSSLSDFMQVLIDPNEFQIVQDAMFASFNNVNTELFYVALLIMGLATLYFLKFEKYLDVFSLGKDTAINLGVDYDRGRSTTFYHHCNLDLRCYCSRWPNYFFRLIGRKRSI